MTRIRAVALIVPNPSGEILILEEHETKPHLGKYAGMRSIPMETCEPGDSVETTLRKLLEQELPGLSIALPGHFIGAYRDTLNVWVRLYVAKPVDSYALPTAPCHLLEVGNHQWVSPQKAVGLWLRRGALEMIQDYAAGRRNVIRLRCNDVKKPAPA